ncbi:hypothetical protein IEQ34_009868 [Dendrobium chrysotoxum]|uniref:DUF4283 domain-containing protein n=1 Tax=Dendrobium chrysotoxum TaxID=161865 RepID=A0AAV7H443_DENCH|nr:hypothetical protein IEQ34_009868 [Dendrobium chrysotoxum]
MEGGRRRGRSSVGLRIEGEGGRRRVEEKGSEMGSEILSRTSPNQVSSSPNLLQEIPAPIFIVLSTGSLANCCPELQHWENCCPRSLEFAAVQPLGSHRCYQKLSGSAIQNLLLSVQYFQQESVAVQPLWKPPLLPESIRNYYPRSTACCQRFELGLLLSESSKKPPTTAQACEKAHILITLLDPLHILIKMINDLDYSMIFCHRSYLANNCYMKMTKWSPLVDVGVESSPVFWLSLTSRKLYPDKVWLGPEKLGYIQQVVMEVFPSFCTSYKCIGHLSGDCQPYLSSAQPTAFPVAFKPMNVIVCCERDRMVNVVSCVANDLDLELGPTNAVDRNDAGLSVEAAGQLTSVLPLGDPI